MLIQCKSSPFVAEWEKEEPEFRIWRLCVFGDYAVGLGVARGKLRDEDIDDNFPDETLINVSSERLKENESFFLKTRFFQDSKPYHLQNGPDRMIRKLKFTYHYDAAQAYCKKQTIVATFSTEAEYVAAASSCGQVLKIHTDENVADLLTKAFDGPRFIHLVVHIGMLNP
ncbi:hypothetical protein Tco_1283532 [Tanacetum coccineum]